jgi:hypothetical protein
MWCYNWGRMWCYIHRTRPKCENIFMANRKRVPTDNEIKEYAETFQALLRHDEPISPFLRRYTDRIHALAREESWATVARVFTHMGLVYNTGRPWSAETLRKVCRKVRAPLRGWRTGPSTPPAAAGTPNAYQPPATSNSERAAALPSPGVRVPEIQPQAPAVTAPIAAQPAPSQRFRGISIKP